MAKNTLAVSDYMLSSWSLHPALTVLFLFLVSEEVPAGKTIRIDVSVIIFPVPQWLFSKSGEWETESNTFCCFSLWLSQWKTWKKSTWMCKLTLYQRNLCLYQFFSQIHLNYISADVLLNPAESMSPLLSVKSWNWLKRCISGCCGV